MERKNNILGRAFRASAHCPEIEQLTRSLDGAAGVEARREAEAHLKQCPNCQTELALLHEFESGASDPEEAAAVNWVAKQIRPARQPKRSVWQFLLRPQMRVWAAAAACLVLAVTAGIRLSQGPGEPIAPQPGTEVFRSQSVEVVSPAEEVAQVPGQFSWRPVRNAARYQVRLLEVDRTELWRTEATETRVEAPADVRSRIRPGATYLWEVTALDAAGKEIGSSGLRTFRRAER